MSEQPLATILHVEDSEANRYAIGRMLRRAGFEVREATTGSEALVLAGSRPDLILLDINLPDMTGYEVCRRIKANPSTAQIPVVHLSASFVKTEHRIRGLEEGADGYLTQPIDPDELAATVRSLLRLRRAEEALRTSEERLRLALDAGRMGTWDWDLAAERIVWSAQQEQMFGFAPGTFPGTFEAFLERVHADDRQRVQAYMQEILATAGEIQLEFRVQPPAGEVRWVAARGQVHRDTAGRATRVLGVVLDVTESRLLDDLTRRRAEQLAEEGRRKDEFLATLGHELRNPLAPIRNALHILRQAADDPATVARAREIAERQVEQMARLIDDLLDVSRIAQGKIELRRRCVDLAVIAAAAVEAVRPQVAARRHDLAVALPAEPTWVDADEARLQQVLTNLLHNAVKFTPAGGHIGLTVTPARGQGQLGDAVVSVRDTGMGIPPDLLPQIFEPFVQADRAHDRAQGGLGIGLSLVKKLVELHGGTVAAHSAGPGQGSEFIFRLPLAPAPAAAEAPAAPAAATPPARRRVLVVDDNADAAESLAVLLQLWGHEVRVAHEGPQALAEAPAFQPHLVLLDIGLPGMDGLTVARHLRSQPGLANTVLVALTGYATEQDRQLTREAGFQHHLVKPVELERLEHLLAEVPG